MARRGRCDRAIDAAVAWGEGMTRHPFCRHCECKRSNPKRPTRLDWFVAYAPRNDPGQAESRTSALLDQIVLEDRHLELKRAVVIFIVDEQHADEFLADINFSGIVFFRPRHHANFLIAEQAL